jgi:hypothetical protein
MNTAHVPHHRQPSLRLLIAVSRLRNGQTPEHVARTMRLPPALVTLLADELDARELQPPNAGEDCD